MTNAIRLGPAHARITAALHAACFEAPWSEVEFARLLEQPGVAGLIWHADTPDGFILVRAAADEAEILTLAVAANRRRRGIAARLLNEACRMLRAGGTRRLLLEVAADNAAARALYEGCGFAVTGRRAGYYDRGAARRVDAIIMELDFAAQGASATPNQ